MPAELSTNASGGRDGVWLRVTRAGDGRIRIQHGPGPQGAIQHGDFQLSDEGAIALALAILREAIELDPEYVQLRVLASLSNL